MHKKPNNLTAWLAIGLTAFPMYAYATAPIRVKMEHGQQPEQEHGEYLAVSPASANINIAMTNTSAVLVESTYTPAVLNLEWLRPHDRLVVLPTTLPVRN